MSRAVASAEEMPSPLGIRVTSMSMEHEHFDDPEMQRTWDKMRMADWVNWLAPWEVISHLTFSWECSLDAGRRAYERFMARHLPTLSYFYALEENPGRDGFHVHALWADARGVYRKAAWSEWFSRYGRARIEPVKRYDQVSNYCAKYVTKEGAWWNVKLQWHRVQAMHGRTFTLTAPTEPAPGEDAAGANALREPATPEGASAVDQTVPSATWMKNPDTGLWNCCLGGGMRTADARSKCVLGQSSA